MDRGPLRAVAQPEECAGGGDGVAGRRSQRAWRNNAIGGAEPWGLEISFVPEFPSKMVGAVGFEPTISCSQSMCANHYATPRPIVLAVLAEPPPLVSHVLYVYETSQRGTERWNPPQQAPPILRCRAILVVSPPRGRGPGACLPESSRQLKKRPPRTPSSMEVATRGPGKWVRVPT